jgi:hypothetical protein
MIMLGATTKNVKSAVAKLESKELRQQYASVEYGRVEDLQKLAVEGLSILGTNAESFIPQITKLFRSPETTFEAASALTKIGHKGFAVLTDSLSDQNSTFRGAAIWAMKEVSPVDTAAANAFLVACLNDPDMVNRHNAASFLAGIDPSAIPVLIKMLDEMDNYLIVSGAAEGLSKFGASAKSASPKLLSIYTNHVFVRDRQSAHSWSFSIMRALKEIDLEAAKQAETLLLQSGPLNIAHEGYTTNLLKSGKELIIGGYIHTAIIANTNHILSKAELNDPKTGKWTETGDLKTARHSHTATVLQDGRVLVAAGTDREGHALASAEIYDPTLGEWKETGLLNTARFYHSATLQSDGKVLVKNGHSGSDALTSSELYDPLTGKWTLIP